MPQERMLALERRLRRCDDILEIQRLFTTYGLGIDGGPTTGLAEQFWTEDPIYDLGSNKCATGRTAFVTMLNNPILLK